MRSELGAFSLSGWRTDEAARQEEVVAGRPNGVLVEYLVEGSNAEASGKIQPGDVLIATTAAKEFGPRWERKLLPTIDMEFDIIMQGARAWRLG